MLRELRGAFPGNRKWKTFLFLTYNILCKIPSMGRTKKHVSDLGTRRLLIRLAKVRESYIIKTG